MIDIADFEAYSHKKIPILEQMGMQIAHYDGQQIDLSFPLAENVNDKGTGFAGSLGAAATYSAWALIHLLLREHDLDLNLAVVSSELEFKRAVTEDFVASTRLPATEKISEFLTKLKTKGKGSIVLESTIMQRNEVALSFKGTYVAFPK